MKAKITLGHSIPAYEDETNEFKESAANLEKEIVAFANHKGGKIFIGVDDDGKIKPIKSSNRSRSQLVQAISNCQPTPIFKIEERDDYIVLHIEEGVNKPYKAPGGFYLRMGANSQKLDRDEIINFFIVENRVCFDSQIIDTIENIETTEYLDVEEIAKFKDQATYLRKLGHKEMLLNLGLLRENKNQLLVTNAGVLLFSKSPQRWFRQARILMWQMGSGTEILDHRIIVGNLSNQFYEAVAYIKANQRTRYDITGLKRTEIPEFPDEILRELVLNQIIHRDYFEHGADIEIKIFPDRIEFSNPAVLPKGKNPADMLGHSYRRNPLLAETFQRIGLIERAGTGLLRVRQLMERENRLPLLLTHEAMYFIATIERSSTNASSGSSNEFELKISRLLKGRTMSSKEISETLSIPVRTLRGKLSELLQSGKIIQIKEGRKILYSLTGKI